MTGLESINFNNLNTSMTTNMSGLFRASSNLETLDLSSFDTSKVTNMSNMFHDIILKSLNLSDFNTSKVTSMAAMFRAAKLKNISIDNFVTTNVTNLGYMFSETNIENLNLSSFDTSNVSSMLNMFNGLQNLQELDISNFTAESLINTACMFLATKFQKIDMRNMNFTNVTEYSLMFGGVDNTTIIVKDEANKKWIEDRYAGPVIVAN